MGWLQGKVQSWAIGKQKRELGNWLEVVSAMDGHEVGMLLAMATNTRHVLERSYQADFLDPILTYSTQPDIVLKLHGVIKTLQSEGKQPQAASVMVWLFTLRCAGAGELRSDGRKLWGALQRGMPHVEREYETMRLMGSGALDISGFDRFPIGFEPTPRD